MYNYFIVPFRKETMRSDIVMKMDVFEQKKNSLTSKMIESFEFFILKSEINLEIVIIEILL